MEKNSKKDVTIIVNGEQKIVQKDDITYDEVATLAFPDFPDHPENTYAITYERGHGDKPQGILSPGGIVKAKEGMTFNVRIASQS